MSAAPTVSLVITTYNREHLLAAALDSVASSRGTAASEVEVIVVDNNSTDGTAQVVPRAREQGFPFALHYIHEPKQGLSHARNAGIAIARGRFIAFMDDDQTIDADYFSRIEPVFEQTGAACAGGPGVYPNLDDVPAWLAPLLAKSVKSVASDDSQGEQTTVFTTERRGYVIGGNMIVRRSDLQQVGGFDTKLGRRGDLLLAAEDFELQDRLYALNKTIAYHSGLIQYHYLHPDRCTRRYWRERHFYHGRTLYLYKLGPRSRKSARLFRAPGWLWRSLVFRDLPGFIGSRLRTDAWRRFEKELAVWHRAGEIYQARVEEKLRRATQ